MSPLLGAIADDFTGATDLANTLVKEGMRAVQVIGVPGEPVDIGRAEAVVVALKSRTAPVGEAIQSSLAALAWLTGLGAKQVFFKYCSTFDSTSDGNIGPVADALMQALDTDFALVCPAFPGAGRVVRDGLLYVNGELLSDSPMKHHPLTPMRESDLVTLMGRQSRNAVGLIDQSVVSRGPKAIAAAVDALADGGKTYGVVDASSETDLRTVGKAASAHRLITGGSGVAMGLPENFRRRGLLRNHDAAETPDVRGRSAVLAGSCSQATRAQIAYAGRRWPTFKIDVDKLASGRQAAGDVVDWACNQPDGKPLMIYASADPEEVALVQQQHGGSAAGEMVEDVLGRIARGLLDQNVRRIVVAGGETSGAVVSALNVRALAIGPEIDPGVPWTQTLGDPKIALALKSGNFGSEDFFAKALRMLR